ncbi:C40 family peptidase, partial [Furfurilactobacillus curtus]
DQFYSNWGNMYYFGDGGARYTNQFYSNWGNMYYFGEGGVRYTNQYYYNWGNTYYFGDGGVLLKNATQWLNSTMYHIDNDGVWIATNPTIEAVVNAAQSQIGLAPYTWGGGRTPASIAAHRFDCSSFVHWAFSQAGIILGNYTSATTWTLEGYGTPVDWSQLRRGDIFFMDDVNHVGIYLGDGYFIHDSPNSSTGGVGINRLTDQVPDLGTWEEIADNINRRIV